MQKIYKLLLSPTGRIGQVEFIIGLAFVFLFTLAQKFIFPHLGQGYLAFFVPMFLFFLTFHMTLSLFAKRLHDIGRSLWPFIGLIFLMIIIAILVSLKFGGLDYFNTVMAHPEWAEDKEAMQKVRQTYEQALAAGLPQAKVLMSIAPLLFTLWLVFSKPQKGQNRYG